MESSFIHTTCIVRGNEITLNDEIIFSAEKSKSFTEFMKEAYHYFNLTYPKFFKMDNLSKLGIICTEGLLLSQGAKKIMESDQCAIILSNHSSSIESDRHHASTISELNNFFPSPSVFVYTLPNIVMGEIAIKHKMQGENLFFLSEKFDAKVLHSTIETLFKTSSTSASLCGWVEFDGNNWESLIYLVQKNEDSSQKIGNFTAHTSEEINKLYNNNHE